MHSFDVELTPHDIQSISSPDAVAAFFVKLGYDTAARTNQTVANLAIPETAARPIKRIELVADHKKLLQVYLFELTSVTVAEIKALARAFRNRAGQFLLVLTSDYEFLEFILLDREFSDLKAPTTISTAQPTLVQRRFSVDRRRPTAIHLRVLRRFTWTEADPFGQFDKLRYAYDLAHWSEPYFNNRALFSDYYLRERLPARDGKDVEFPEWREDPKPAYQRLRSIYEDAGERFAGKETSDLVGLLYEPLLRELGFKLNLQGSTDIGLHLRLEDPTTGALLGICLPYPWGRELDRKDEKHDTEAPEVTPTFAVVDVLAKEKVPWVILTNGKMWRLYSQRAHSRATNYYEVDLDEVLGRQGFQQDIQDAFRYFWLLFRVQAFRPVARDWLGKRQSLSMLDRLLFGSEEYAKELGEKLKNRVFTEVFPVLSEGFIASMRQRGDTDFDDDRLATVFQGTLTLLYRLLFLLYAESRALLPVHAREYREPSFQHLKEEIKEAAGTIDDETEKQINRRFEADSYGLWKRLKTLFHVIDQGSEELNVPRYNGGLFLAERDKDDHSPEAEAARFLERERTADRYLARAIDLLARAIDPKRHDLVSVDYKSLGVRQLGSIYEGLLEFRLQIAAEKLAIVKEKGREVYSPFRDLSEREKTKVENQGAYVSRGHAYLENDKRERKATGSYYTPDHIVKYIVEHAVGPVLQEKFDTLRPKLREAQRERREFFKQQEEFTKRGMKPKPAEQADLIGKELVDEIFNIKVLDPAMGSGHFLVEAVDYITDKTLEFLNGFPWNPVLVHLEKMRNIVQEQMDEQNIDIDAKRLTDVNLLKRHVLKRCIYGVDLNPMAVELAKVSLWLDCFTLGAPLSFLDHHLRWGNSLIGTTIAEVDAIREAKGQLSLTGTSDWQGLTQAVQAMVDVGGMPDITADQVTDSKKQFQSALAGVEVFKRVLDLHTARWFVERGKPRTVDILDEMLKSGELFEWAHGHIASPLVHTGMAKAGREAVGQAIVTSEQNRFFHWELEFPEVFYGRKPGTQNAVVRLETAGFDAVIGNPPYDVVASEELGRDVTNELTFYRQRRSYATAIRGKTNLYKLFIAKAIEVLCTSGGTSFIVPMALLGDDQSAGIRRTLLDKTRLSSIEVFPQKDDAARRVFPEAKLSTAIFVCRHGAQSGVFVVRTHPAASLEEVSGQLEVSPGEILAFDPENWAIPSCQQKDWSLAVRIVQSEHMLRMRQIATSFQGEVNETTERSRGVFCDDARSPIALRGANLSMYALRDASQGEELHLNVRKFLSGKKEDSKAFDYKAERIGFQRSSPQNNFRRLIAARLPAGSHCLDTISYVTEKSSRLDLCFILLLLNSRILDWYFRLGSTNSKVNEYQFNALPVLQVKMGPKVPLNEIRATNDNWPELIQHLSSFYSEPGSLPRYVYEALLSLCARIEKIENRRVLTKRSERSHLSSQSQPIQDVIDAVLFQYYGLSPEEGTFIEGRLREML
jgi:type I restriction-modification system DNA methylase subunit